MTTKAEKIRTTNLLKKALTAHDVSDKKVLEILATVREMQVIKPAKVTKQVAARILEVAPAIGDIALVMRTKKGFRVFSQSGHATLSRNAKTHQPWLKSKAAKVKSASPV